MLPSRRIFCNVKNNNGKITNFIPSRNTNRPTGDSGATSLPLVGKVFMYIETSSNNNRGHVFDSLERIDSIQITNITFYCIRYSILTNNRLKSKGRFRIQLLLKDNTWSTQYTIAKISQYSDASTDWTSLNLDFTVENYGIGLIYDQIDSSHANMCFSIITITYSV